MKSPATAKLVTFVLGFGLIFVGIGLSILYGIVRGGFKFGNLERRMDTAVARAEVEGFLNRSYQRLAELGFRSTGGPGEFVQGRQGADEHNAYTHARTRKQLTIALDDQTEPVTAAFTLRYLDPIVADSGESAYRDAVLDYVSGKTDAMQLVPNLSFMAVNSLTIGAVSLAALVVLKLVHFGPVLAPMCVAAGTGFCTGILALISIRKKPGESTGTGVAACGIVLCALALACAAALSVLELFGARG